MRARLRPPRTRPRRKLASELGLLALLLGVWLTPALAGGAPEPGSQREERRAARAAYFQALDRYGEWLSTRSLGEVWRPFDPGTGWVPYRNGRWERSENGWGWVAHEPWGWVTYHHGRWWQHEHLGWVWSPGSEWAPAWVIWRRDAEAVGWAPLPPPGLRVYSAAWTFVPARSFGQAVEGNMVATPQLPALLLRMRSGRTATTAPPGGGNQAGNQAHPPERSAITPRGAARAPRGV